jgi:septum formation protein
MYERECAGPFRLAERLILASGSPRRRELLSRLGLEFTVRPSDAGEPLPEAGEDCAGYALRTARQKTLGVADDYPDAITLGADTIVVLDGAILGKPAGLSDAVAMLVRLAGRRHEVITAVCLVWPDAGVSVEFSTSTQVWLARQPLEVLEAYAATGEPLDKAGGYAIQGAGSFLVERIEGSFSNVVGLPLHELISALRGLKVLMPVVGR